jgi:hypothetical protein
VPMDRTENRGGTKVGVEALHSMIETASKMVERLADDPLLARFLAVFARMPQQDREPILGIIEREVDARLLTDATAETMSGIRLFPNPSARLYARAIDRDVEAPLNRSETVMASVRAMRMFGRTVGPASDVWAENMRAALQELDPDELDTMGQFVDMLAAEIAGCRTPVEGR